MPQFVLDTAGAVELPAPTPNGEPAAYEFSDLDAFTQGYIEALFFTETCVDYAREEWETLEARTAREEGTVSGEVPSDCGFADLAPETLAAIIADCAKFQASDAYQILAQDDANGNVTPGTPDDAQCGHDFWLTRNGHGAGFWDGDWPEPYATALDGAAKAFGEVSVYLGDDGKVYAQ